MAVHFSGEVFRETTTASAFEFPSLSRHGLLNDVATEAMDSDRSSVLGFAGSGGFQDEIAMLVS